MPAHRPSRKRTRPQFEMLECRVMPAVVPPTVTSFDSHHVRYVDLDNDVVTVSCSQAIFPNQAAVNSILTFADDTDTVIADPFLLASGPAYLQEIELAGLPVNLSLSVKVTSKVGDGLAEVGLVDANMNIRNLFVGGRLFNLTTTADIRNLTVTYLGTGDISSTSHDAADFAGSTSVSTVGGNVAVFTVLRNIDNAFFDGSGNIRKVVVYGNMATDSLLGTPSTDDDTSAIHASGLIFSAQISGAVVGGAGARSGSIRAGKVGSVQVKKDLVGGSGDNSGWIRSEDVLTDVGVNGNLQAGTGAQSGRISAAGQIKSAYVQKDMIGGTVDDTGTVVSDSAGIDLLRIGGSLRGGGGMNTGTVTVATLIKQAKVDGQAVGGGGDNSGSIFAANITQLTIAGLQGGVGMNSGSVVASMDLTAADVNGALSGGTGDYSGSLVGDTISGTVNVTGGVVGGGGVFSGAIVTKNALGGLGTLTIGGDLQGSAGANSGSVNSAGSIKAVSVRGSVLAGSGVESGEIFATSDITGLVRIGRNLVGGPGDTTGRIFAGSLATVAVFGNVNAGFIHSESTIKRVFVHGWIYGGALPFSGSILALGTISEVVVDHSVFAGEGDDTGVIISHANLTRVTIRGDLDGTSLGRVSDTFQVGARSARVAADGNIGFILVYRVFGGNNDDTGEIMSDADSSGAGNIGTLRIALSIQGGSAYGGAGGNLVINSGYVQGYDIVDAAAFALIAGVDNGADLVNSGAIRAVHDIDSLTVQLTGSGNSTARTTISAMNEMKYLRVAQVGWTDILVGYAPSVYVDYELTSDADAKGNFVMAPAFLLAPSGAPMDPSDPTQFNPSAVVTDFAVTYWFSLSNFVVSVDPGTDMCLGTSDDDTRSGVVTKGYIPGPAHTGSYSGLYYVIAAATMPDFHVGTPAQVHANPIASNPPLNLLAGRNLDLTKDYVYVLLYS